MRTYYVQQGGCRQQVDIGVVSPSVPHDALVADEAAYFLKHHGLKNKCGADVTLFHTEAETHLPGYTAGDVHFGNGFFSVTAGPSETSPDYTWVA